DPGRALRVPFVQRRRERRQVVDELGLRLTESAFELVDAAHPLGGVRHEDETVSGLLLPPARSDRLYGNAARDHRYPFPAATWRAVSPTCSTATPGETTQDAELPSAKPAHSSVRQSVTISSTVTFGSPGTATVTSRTSCCVIPGTSCVFDQIWCATAIGRASSPDSGGNRFS